MTIPNDVTRVIRGDIEMPPLVPQGPQTPEVREAAKQLTADIFALVYLFESMAPSQRRHVLQFLARQTGVEVQILPKVIFP